MPPISSLPHELLDDILARLRPSKLLELKRVDKFFYRYINTSASAHRLGVDPPANMALLAPGKAPTFDDINPLLRDIGCVAFLFRPNQYGIDKPYLTKRYDVFYTMRPRWPVPHVEIEVRSFCWDSAFWMPPKPRQIHHDAKLFWSDGSQAGMRLVLPAVAVRLVVKVAGVERASWGDPGVTMGDLAEKVREVEEEVAEMEREMRDEEMED